MKQCSMCKKEKPKTEFQPRKDAPDGFRGMCKMCVSIDKKNRRVRNLERDRAYDRQPERIAKHKKRNRIYNRIQKMMNPEKRKARQNLQDARRFGRIFVPDACSRCGKLGPVQGHHHDYKKQLDVTWLCVQCHSFIHSNS